jgi:hypothetical protein
MSTRYSVICDDDIAHEIRLLARENDITEEEVIRQLIQTGLESLEPIP